MKPGPRSFPSWKQRRYPTNGLEPDSIPLNNFNTKRKRKREKDIETSYLIFAVRMAMHRKREREREREFVMGPSYIYR